MRKVTWLLILVCILFLAVGCESAVQRMVAYELKPNYVSISETLELQEDTNWTDLSSDEQYTMLKKWAETKYELWPGGDGASADANTVPALLIGPNEVGIFRYQNRYIVLAPRLYPDIPSDDDEITKTAALLVGAGKIAYRINLQGAYEYRFAKETPYLEPLADWQVVDALNIGANQIAWRTNPDTREIETITKPGIHGDQVHGFWTVEPYLVVPPGYRTYRILESGLHEFRGPGSYPEYISSQWATPEPAIFIGPNEYGEYTHLDGTVSERESGWHYDLLVENLQIYYKGLQRYRTLHFEVWENNRNANDPACLSTVPCETAISSIVVSGTQTLATFNLDITFEFLRGDEYDEAYRYLGGVVAAVQNFIATPARSTMRIECSIYTPNTLRTPQGIVACQDKVLAKLNATTVGVPIRITAVSIRSMDFDDAELIAAAQAAEVAQQEAESRIEVAQLNQQAFAAEQALQQDQFQVWLSQQAAIMELVTQSGISAEQLWILYAAGIIEFYVDPSSGDVVVPNQNPYVVTPLPTPVQPVQP